MESISTTIILLSVGLIHIWVTICFSCQFTIYSYLKGFLSYYRKSKIIYENVSGICRQRRPQLLQTKRLMGLWREYSQKPTEGTQDDRLLTSWASWWLSFLRCNMWTLVWCHPCSAVRNEWSAWPGAGLRKQTAVILWEQLPLSHCQVLTHTLSGCHR